MIKVNAISLQLEQQRILDDINFEADAGDYLAIVGPNGSGKSSLLKLINRIHPPSSGSIQLKGVTLPSYSQRELAKLVSYVPQSSGRCLPFVVEDFIRMARYPYHSALSDWTHEDTEAVELAMQITDTVGFKTREMTTLSGGESQRVMIAAALCQQAPIMLLDEPTSYLDPHHQVEVHRLIKKLNQSHHITMIEVTHDINHAAQNAKHVLALADGKVLWQGSSDDFLEASRLEALYAQKFDFLTHPETQRTFVMPQQ